MHFHSTVHIVPHGIKTGSLNTYKPNPEDILTPQLQPNSLNLSAREGYNTKVMQVWQGQKDIGKQTTLLPHG